MRTTTHRSGASVGRPKGGDAGKRRTILDTAIAGFLAHGYEHTSVDVIAERAGVAKQTVYNHFGDKQALFLSAVNEERARAAERFVSGDPSPTDESTQDAKSALIVLARNVLAVLLDDRASALRRLVIGEASRHPALRPACADGEPEQLVGRIADSLRSRCACGELDVPDPDTTARQFVALVTQQGLHASMYGTTALSESEADTISAEAAALIVRACLPASNT